MRLVRYIPENEMPEEVNEVTNSSPASEAEQPTSPEQPEPAEQADQSTPVDSAQPSPDQPEQNEPAPADSAQPSPESPEPSEQQDGPVIDTPEEAAANAQAAADASSSAEPQVDLGILESLLFSTHHPLTAPRLAELMELSSSKPLRNAIKALNTQYEETHRCFRIEQVAGGYQLLTLPEYGEYLKKLNQREADAKLTKAALETLAIIAYKQPILRAELESIRGVACGETIRSLMEKHLVKIAGRAEEPGRPILYGTTKRFLELFGLNSLKDLPKPEEAALAPKPSPRSTPAPSTPASPEVPATPTESAPTTPSEPAPATPTESAPATSPEEPASMSPGNAT
ncbi:MAG: SMC-Scp complex subunit ScpB, partial [Bacillota bacterium]